MSEQRPDIIRRKAQQITDERPPRKILVDILKASAIIADNFTGSIVLNFNQGGITGYDKIEKGII